MDKKSVTLAVSAGIAIAVAVGGWFWWSKREEKKTAKKYKAVYVLGGPGSGKCICIQQSSSLDNYKIYAC